MDDGTESMDGRLTMWTKGVFAAALILYVGAALVAGIGSTTVRDESFPAEQAALQRIGEDIDFLEIRVDSHFKNAEFHAAQAAQMQALCDKGFECDKEEIEAELRRAAAERALQEKLSAGLLWVSEKAAEAAVANYEDKHE